MKKILVVLFVFFMLCSSFTLVHKFYVSVTQIEYNEEQKSLQIISRIFIDDIEEVFRQRYDENIALVSKKDEAKIDQYLSRYLNQKLIITIDEQEVVFNFIGKEYDNDLVLCYLEVENVSSFTTIEVSNRALMDFFEEQQNIVHVKKGGKRKSMILEKEKDKGVLKFSEY